MKLYDKIANAVVKKGYKFFEGDMDPNFIVERTNNKYTNAFTDRIYILLTEDGVNKAFSWRGTSKPGLYGKGAVMSNYKSSAGGVTGTASIVPGQYIGLWEMMFLDKLDRGAKCMSGNPHYAPSLHQRNKVIVARDNNKDLIINPNLKTTEGSWYGINGHYMGFDVTPDVFTDDNLNNWSVGCVGSPAMDWFKIMCTLADCAPITGNRLSLTLITSCDV